MARFDGKIALITGGSRGIGRSIAHRLAREGAAVAINYRTDREGAEATVRSIEEEGGRAFAFHYSTDGERWDLVRHFALASLAPLETGFLAQSPTGDGCRAMFTDVRFSEARLADIRSGA